MVFGACCIVINDRIQSMNTKSIKIQGVQRGLLVNFEVTQTFYHTEKKAKEVSYVFPNDLKICIYDTIFVVGDEIIKPKLQSIKSITGANVDKIDEINLSDKDDERKCLATILSIAAMRAKSAGDKNSWTIIEQKALAWLKKKLPDVNIEQVISNIQALIR